MRLIYQVNFHMHNIYSKINVYIDKAGTEKEALAADYRYR